ncbi:MAG: hypothetical protein A3I06_07665 [Candidatus Lindowbacteria bacterium RIFCSPLOWO2_02_FULL_62_12]|nr:MAG: hypothetical protein A3I06_07665 [Candidatus Lindowbacteria bacterium RIFCSPLOWO2_02_FULL_62_12]
MASALATPSIILAKTCSQTGAPVILRGCLMNRITVFGSMGVSKGPTGDQRSFEIISPSRRSMIRAEMSSWVLR